VKPLVMGVLNVTPDSFSDGGRWPDPATAVAHGLAMVADGADVVDIGGESTRPGASPVAVDEELRRVLPVVEALAPHVRISIDTNKAAVAAAAVGGPGVGWVAMHMQGEPRTMQRAPFYDDVMTEVRDYLVARAIAARAAGVAEVWIDPGIGFGKTVAHNLVLLRRLSELVATGFPVMVGTSRKSFLGRLTGDAPVDDRVEASVATAAWALDQGAAMVRVHDVRETVAAARLLAARTRP